MRQMLLKDGNLYLDSDLYETYFKSIDAVVLLRRDATFLLMPVQQSGGGLLLKIRNAKGDRVVHAAEFFQNHGVNVSKQHVLNVEWNPDYAALVFRIPETPPLC